MSGRYDGRIKVVTEDRKSFPVCPRTLDALGVAYFDPYPGLDGAVEMIHLSEWALRLNRKWEAAWGKP